MQTTLTREPNNSVSERLVYSDEFEVVERPEPSPLKIKSVARIAAKESRLFLLVERAWLFAAILVEFAIAGGLIAAFSWKLLSQ